MRKEIETLTRLEDNKFAVKYKGDKKTYLVQDENNDIILSFLIAGIINS